MGGTKILAGRIRGDTSESSSYRMHARRRRIP